MTQPESNIPAWLHEETAWRAIADSSPNVMVLLDKNGNILYLNRSFTGIAPAELIGRFMLEFILPDYHEEFKEQINKVFTDGHTGRAEARGMGAGGHPVFWTEAHFSPLKYKGTIVAAIVKAIDITWRKELFEALKTNERHYRELAESIKDPFYAFDKDLRYTYWNKASEKLTGIKTADAIGKSFKDIFGDTLEAQRIERIYRAIILTGKPEHFTNQYTLEDKIRYFDIYAYPTPTGLTVIARDITRQKETEQKLKENDQRYRTVVETLQEGLAIVDRNENIIFTNNYFNKQMGYAPATTVGKNLKELVPPEEFPKILQGTARRKKGMPGQYELKMKCRDGTIKDMLVSISPWPDEKGNYQRAVGLVMDITRSKQTEKILAQKNIALKELLEQLSIEKKVIAERTSVNLEKILLPKLRRLKNKLSPSEQKHLKAIERNIKNITSGFGTRISDKRRHLSPREIEVADLIKEGLKNKAIARELSRSIKTIETIRKSVRKKLKISNKQVNLRTYLKEF